MQLQIVPIHETQVQQLVCWRYAPPYEVYNLDPNSDEATLAYFLDPANAYHAILDESGEMVGFCSFGTDGQVPGGDYRADALDIGMGMRPDLTGHGHGATFRDAVIAFALDNYAPPTLRVTIADFNQRAKRVWEKAGFEPVQRFRSEFSGLEFVVFMKRVTMDMNDDINDENWLHADTIKCPYCAQNLYRVDHSPMLDNHTLYCSKCANSVEVSFYDPIYSAVYQTMLCRGVVQYREFMQEIEQRLKPCSCGGLFKHDAARRCYNCGYEVIKNETGVDLLPDFFGIDIGERDPSEEEMNLVYSFEAKHIRRENIWK